MNVSWWPLPVNKIEFRCQRDGSVVKVIAAARPEEQSSNPGTHT